MSSDSDTTPAEQVKSTTERPIRQRVELATAAVGLATAVVTMIVAMHSVSSANDKATASQHQSSQVTNQNETLQQQVSEAEATISALKDQLASGPAATTDATAPSIYHTGTFVLRADGEADLDAPANFPNWDEDNADSGSGDIWIDTSSGEAMLDAPSYITRAKLVLISGTANYEKCRRETGYSQDDIPVSALIKGSTVCVATNEDRLSMVHIKSASSAAISMTITTYDGDFSAPS